MKPPDGDTAAQRLFPAARSWALDLATAEVVDAQERVGVHPIVLKGPSVARWLYPDGTRTYVDVDILVGPHHFERAEEVLRQLGFVKAPFELERPPDWPRHADTWTRELDGVFVDLHRTLSGLGPMDGARWRSLACETEPLQLAGRVMRILAPPARALHLALHAAQHGPAGQKSVRDLERALEQLPDELWESVASLAVRLDATAALATGLRLLPAGRVLARRLDLGGGPTVQTTLLARSAPTMALSFEWLSTARFGAGLRFLARRIVPSPAYMRSWSRLARHGRAGLASAYLWRLAVLIWRGRAALAAWRRARTDTRRGS